MATSLHGLLQNIYTLKTLGDETIIGILVDMSIGIDGSGKGLLTTTLSVGYGASA